MEVEQKMPIKQDTFEFKIEKEFKLTPYSMYLKILVRDRYDTAHEVNSSHQYGN